jgi:hypothetical protein
MLLAAASVALAAGLCWLLAQQLLSDPPVWRSLIDTLSWPWLLMSLVLTGALLITGAHKWRLWRQAQNPEIVPADYALLLRHYSWQSWLGLFIPLPLAIIAGRSLQAKAHWRRGAINGLWDQAFELAAMLGLIPISLIILFNHSAGWAVGFGASALLCGLWIAGLRRWGPVWLKPMLPLLIGYSFVRVLLMIIRAVAMLMALGIALSALKVAAAMPLLSLLAIMPLTPGNLGLTEWGWVGVLSVAGEEPQTVALFAFGARLLIYCLQTLLTVGISLLCYKHKKLELPYDQ